MPSEDSGMKEPNLRTPSALAVGVCQKKHHITLIEVMISLFLTSIILTVLFGYFVQITKIEKKLEVAKADVFQKQHIQIRLSNIFSNASLKKFSDEQYFFTEKEKNEKTSLYFAFDNGIDPDPKFSGIVVGKLFIDDEKNLKLKIWGTDNKEILENIVRDETLFKNIKKIEFRFLSNKEPENKAYKKEAVSKDLEWIDFWSKEKNYLPSIIKLKLSDDLDFSFFLPSKMLNISYPKKRVQS